MLPLGGVMGHVSMTMESKQERSEGISEASVIHDRLGYRGDVSTD